ncbi:leucyl/phenylalanyl-tRNA--protein transferase [Pseudomonadota bacterium]
MCSNQEDTSGPYWIDQHDTSCAFPPVEHSLREPNGLLAAGGDLSPKRLIYAYSQGIFPWYSDDQPILWWSPDPRAVLLPEQLIVSRSLRKKIRQNKFIVTLDQSFEDVLIHCALPREKEDSTWITEEMHRAYMHLHKIGVAHSVEAWQDNVLVGGLYGLGIGRVFFGESMFSIVSDASKVAFTYAVRQLQQWGYKMIDCQVSSEHLASLGAVDIPRSEFIQYLGQCIDQPGRDDTTWQFDEGFHPLNPVNSDE